MVNMSSHMRRKYSYPMTIAMIVSCPEVGWSVITDEVSVMRMSLMACIRSHGWSSRRSISGRTSRTSPWTIHRNRIVTIRVLVTAITPAWPHCCARGLYLTRRFHLTGRSDLSRGLYLAGRFHLTGRSCLTRRFHLTGRSCLAGRITNN